MAFAAERPELSYSEFRPVGDVERAKGTFEVISDYEPAGDQPAAIAELAERLDRGERDVVLMGATGTGKSATAAWLIEKVQRPTLVMAPNKTLAAQLGILRLVLRLLPTRGVHRADGYLHRKGLVHQRGRGAAAPLRHIGTVVTPGRGGGLLGLVHLRPRCARGVPARHGRPAGGRALRP